MEIDNKISHDILPYFLEIAKRLWNGKASVIVGAGFSLNSIKNNTSNNVFPDWKKLGDIFYEKIHNKKPANQEHYLNVLKLAEEIEAMWDRPTLDQLLIDSIPDKSFRPSKLHQQLLELPWNDVFTTNYDTLLERASYEIKGYEYSIIKNKADFYHSKSKKIIKLHGSFPSHKPFIITEEDYREYPKKFAPFVNSIQQALLEDTVCLIGFSGDDPNFLEWNGWLIDNLGKEGQKVYLIGLLNLSEPQKKIFIKRNIIPLDLANCEGVNEEHSKAFDLFFEYLHSYEKEEIPDKSIGWPENNKLFHFSHDKNIALIIPTILENWISIRQKYPNWIIVPEDRREVLNNYTGNSISFAYHLSKIELPFDIQFLYEFNWRIEKCLIPIYNDLIVSYENVIEKYNPFPNLINIENAITPNSKSKKNLDWDEITHEWLEIQLSIMRFYREEGFHEKWQLIAMRLSKLLEKLVPELQARYYYERCLYSLFSLNIAEVRRELKTWPVNSSLPFWEAKRAGLLAEIGEVIEAEKILENSLEFIRKQLSLSTISNDYSYVSQEAYIMQLLKYVKSAASNIKGVYHIPADISKSYTERWNTLVQYKCDPWSELQLFKIHLDKEPGEFKELEKKYGFDIGHVTETYKFGGYDKYAAKAYSYLRFIEEIGIPYRLHRVIFGKEAAQGAIKHIAKYSPYWAFASFVRMGDSKIADSIFSRKSISRMNVEHVDNLINEYLSVLKKSVSEIKNGDTSRNINFAISLANVIPEILSRLCVKCSHGVKLKLLSFLKEVFESELRDRYGGIRNLTERLISSFSKSNQYLVIPILLEFPVLSELHHFIDKEYIDPFSIIEIDKKILNKVPKIKIDNDKIKEQLEIAQKSPRERRIALMRLIKLWELNCLSKSQTEQLAKTLWSKTDESTGFPEDTNYYYFAFINFPHPANIVPEQLFKTYISNSAFPIQANKKKKGISMTGGDIHLFHEIRGTSKLNINYTWSKGEISLLIKKAVEWWDADKKYLKEKDTPGIFGSTPDEFIARFRNLVSLFSNIFSPNYQLIEESEKKELQRILNEFEDFGVLNVEAKASCFHLLPHTQNEIYSSIYENLFSKSNNKVIDALEGFKKLLGVSADNVGNLLKIISEHVRNRHETGIVSFIKVITLVVKEYPKLINDKILSDLKIGLTNLISETVILPQDTYENIANKISYKREASYLTVALKNYFNSKKEKTPDYVKEWKKLCLDKNEFSEIRRIWEDA